MRIRQILFIGSFFFALTVNAQDLHFSQYYMSPLTLNPALTGLFNGNYRLTANYRNQWESILPSTPFRTIAASAELSGKSGRYNRIGVGLSFFSDQAGSLDLAKTQASVSLAYLLALSRDHDYYIAAGIQVSYNDATFSYDKLTTGARFNSIAYSPSLPTGLPNLGDRQSYIDAAAGILWYHIKNVRQFEYIGFAAFHVNQPNVSFISNSIDQLYAKYLVHGGAGFKIQPKFDLNPFFLGMIQGPDFEVNVGLFFKFILDEKKNTAYGGTSFYIGPFLRVVGNNSTAIAGDAVIFATKIEIDQITMGLSYDVNISGLSPATSGRGGPEFSIQYIGAFKNKPAGTFCPKF